VEAGVGPCACSGPDWVCAFQVFGGLSFSLFPQGFKGAGDIQVRSWADPSVVDLHGTATARVEVKNVGKEGGNIRLWLETYNQGLYFVDTGTQKVNETVSLGPGESRELGFRVKVNATYGGRYGLKVTVSPGGENIEDEIFFTVAGK